MYLLTKQFQKSVKAVAVIRYSLTCLFLLCFAQKSYTQDLPAADYLYRAELIYANVWKDYQAQANPGLFTENYPSAQNDSLTYLQGSAVKERPVSFLWPLSGMFSATNALVSIPAVKEKYKPYLIKIISSVEQYRDTTRSPVGYQAYPVKFEKADRYYDDNGLVGIDEMEAYFNTKNPLYLQRAKTVFTFIISGWDDQLGGGVSWLEGHRDQKPACSNGMAALVALKIYQATKDPHYLNWGEKFYGWMYEHLRDSSGVYDNDIKPDGKVNKTFWTYNSGSMLEASVLLYQFTGNKLYLKQAQQLAISTYTQFKSASPDSPLLFKIDLPWFVTILFRGYEALYLQDGNKQYITAVEKDLNYAWQHSRDQYGLLTHSWKPNPADLKKPKWLLDENCIAELYARLYRLKDHSAN
ncbi:glycoside hydrolase family 76 protein [Pedobacter sp. L105]|uniref:glycoside hydrolase family 76 protein n=1 Tax=Pedobacter sp. L105 TaxID=1641871 RepID=UPI00131C975F|nr:glycoside hydrolase family 76 protein [Pedobacter sp. L105]